MICIDQKQEYFDFINDKLEANFSKAEAVSITSLDGEKIMGVVVLSNFSAANCEISVASTSTKFISKRFLDVVFHYPFITAGLNRVSAVVREDNFSSIDLVERLGFMKECVLTGFYHNKNGILYRMLHSECKWIRNNNG